MSHRGILFMVWGNNERVRAALPRAVESVKSVHPELPITQLEMPDDSDLRCKSRMFELSPYDQTLYLDVDTVVLGRLDFAFAKAARHGIACCINVSPWANRYVGLKEHGDITEFDTGVVFFDKRRAGVADLFQAWEWAGGHDSTSYFYSATGLARMPINDQCGFAHAIEAEKFNPWVLPLNWNLHPKWQKTVFGPIRVWHDYNDVSDGVRRWNEQQSRPDAINSCGQIRAP